MTNTEISNAIFAKARELAAGWKVAQIPSVPVFVSPCGTEEETYFMFELMTSYEETPRHLLTLFPHKSAPALFLSNKERREGKIPESLDRFEGLPEKEYLAAREPLVMIYRLLNLEPRI